MLKCNKGDDIMSKEEFILKILEKDNQNMNDEDMISLILNEKVSCNLNKLHKEKYTTGEKVADKLAKVAGSWGFICTFLFVLVFWMLTNAIILTKAFDPYPFILLNLLLSCVAAFQAPVIMMSQNRQEQKDRIRAENDYIVNLKSEIILEDLYNKICNIEEKMNK